MSHVVHIGDIDSRSHHVSSASVNLLVVLQCVLNLFDIDGLVVLVEQLYLVLPEQQDDLVLDVLLLEGFEYGVALVVPELLPNPVGDLAADLLHDLHVRPLSDLGRDLHHVPVMRHVLHARLRDVLVEHLVVELFWVAVYQAVIELALVGLDHVGLAGRGYVGELVVERLGVPGEALVVHDLFVVDRGVLHLNEAVIGPVLLGAPPVGRAATVLAQVVVHGPVEALVVPFEAHLVPHVEHLVEQVVVLPLDGRRLPLEDFVPKRPVTLVVVSRR